MYISRTRGGSSKFQHRCNRQYALAAQNIFYLSKYYLDWADCVERKYRDNYWTIQKPHKVLLWSHPFSNLARDHVPRTKQYFLFNNYWLWQVCSRQVKYLPPTLKAFESKAIKPFWKGIGGYFEVCGTFIFSTHKFFIRIVWKTADVIWLSIFSYLTADKTSGWL